MKIVIVLLVVLAATVAIAGEKEELQWKARALIAEVNLAQCQSNVAQNQGQNSKTAIQDFLHELDAKGYVIDNQGNVAPKPVPEMKGDKK